METNTSSTSTSSSSHISLSSTLSLPKSCSKHITSKIENLVEYSYIPESAQINESQFPILSPYNLYKQKTSFTRSIRTLISTKRPLPKEYIQSSRLDQCALQASQSEQYVTMEIPSDLVANWKREGYTHLHLGGVRLILTLHGRKGLPVTARIALLDTRFKEYQHTVVGTVLTTLHAGSVLLTFYPNFNLSLEDPNLPTTLKNHALDLPTPYTTSDALMILVDTDTIPTIIQIPKQIQKQELLRLMPLEWLTNYEHFHQNSEPVQTTEARFDRRPNGQVKLSFQTPDTKTVSDSPQLSYTAMITAVQTGQEKKLPIHGFSSEGYPVYPDKINGHFLWDVPEAHMCNPNCPCLDDTDIDEELEEKEKKKKKSSHPPPSCKSFLPQPPPDPKPPAQPIRSCLMFSSHSYEESFPPLEKQTDTQTRVTLKPFVQSPITASGQPEEPKQYEAVLNWQTKNASAQNHTLQQLGKKIDRVATQVSQTETKVDSISSRLDQMYIHLQDRISELDADLRRMINNHIWGPEFNKKNAEIRKLKAELSRIDAEKTRPSLFTQSQPIPVSPPFFETYSPFYTPSRPQQPVYNRFFGFSHLQLTPQPSLPKKARSKVKISEPRPKATSSSSTSTIPPEESPQDRPEPLKKDKGPMDQYHYHTVQTQSSDSSDSSEPETHNSCSSSSYDSSNASTDSESEYADITGILMATETVDPSASTSTPIVDDNPSDQASQTEPIPPPVHEHSTKPSSASWFTFDDIPRHKWVARLQEFAAWIDLQGSKDISVISTVQTINHVSTIPRPSLKMSILPSKFHKPIPVIGFIDTGADTSMIDPSVLPSDSWEPHSKLFRAVNGETFETTLITKKPIGIQFFPNYIIWKKIVASKLPDKDLLIGFDILHLGKKLFLTSSGVRYKQMFLPYTDTLRLYALSETPSPYSHISQKLLEFCPENHSQFHHPSPLWKNEQFFIQLPFKLNEDINPTKVSHPDWAWQAFYVEKRSELVLGKKRLVIDYQPLNSFLKDDKFPLPKIQTLFVHLQGARIFSKFDLKAGFWQLGISPVDRHKTAFCIPDAHYQWMVMPFGLKVAPSLFQKSMTKIFSPILHHALVYIDDILLFSSDHESHQKLLLDFFRIVQAHGIMLSKKKSSIGKESIDFLGMVIKDGQYQPGPHIAIELLKFPDTHLNRKQIQQFLGIVNYVRDFIPKVAIHTSQLSPQAPPPLRIPTSGQRILQTDASDDYWSAILLEDINGVRHFCAHASGQFKDSEKNYHVIYKEILAVKYGIKKFEFHLISHKFLINMDNSSFPRIFDFKNKLLPDKQLLSLKTWFSKYDFTVQHIKSNQNLIPDFLTRPAINKPALISSIQTIPVIAMNRQLPFKALNQRNFPMNISFQSAYQLQDFAKKFLYRFFFNVQTKNPDRFLNLCMEHLFLTGLTLSSLSISEDELWYMWCLTTLYATKLVFPIKPILTHLTTPEFSPDLLWTLFEWYSPLTWWHQQLQHLSTFHGLDKMSAQEANMWTTSFIVHRPYFQHLETRDYWTQDMAHEWRTYPHPYTFIHDTSVTSVLKAYLMELNNVPPPTTDIHHTSIRPSHTLEIIPKTQGCTPGSSSSPHGILVMEQRPDYTNVLFQDAQDPWEDFQSLLHTDTPHYTVTNPNSPAPSTSQHMSEVNEEKYQQAEAYLDQRQRRRHKRQYEKDTGDVSPSRYPSTP
ncbi:hypothetical protein KPL71_001187 [Citrus sinensis]|uniref:Uncharacterized protein n=1 Tax=Citrus sinensis TaxID=2711 RepID=A0ACB8NWJ1_CITSI|nr:hypothetical protein KPL71_001187 [Citrus sinensis]